jgi:hypothetical protein
MPDLLNSHVEDVQMNARNLRSFFSMLMVGAVAAFGGRALADVFTVPAAACHVVSASTPNSQWDCPLPNYTPAFPFSGVGEVWFDGDLNTGCAANMTLSIVRQSYTGSISHDDLTISKYGPFDEKIVPALTAQNPDVWDYVHVSFATSVFPSGNLCRTGYVGSVYGVSVVR